MENIHVFHLLKKHNNHYSVAFSRLVIHLNIVITFIHNKQTNFLNIFSGWRRFFPFNKIFNHQSVVFCHIKSLDWQKYFSLNQVSLPSQAHLTWICSPSSISSSGSGTKSWSVSLSNTAHVQSLSFSVEWDIDWNEILFQVLMFGTGYTSADLSSSLKHKSSIRTRELLPTVCKTSLVRG